MPRPEQHFEKSSGFASEKCGAIPLSWVNSIALAYSVYVGHAKDPTGGALWYHADYVSPWWGRVLKRNRKIGIHIFYVHNEDARAAWARPGALKKRTDKVAEAIRVSQLREALTLDPID